MSLRLVIKGAYYYDGDEDTILVPHFTGEYRAVDCTRYVRMSQLKESYDEQYIEGVRHNPIEYEGHKYYYAEYSPEYVSEEWELLSDLADLMFYEENLDF